MSDAIDLKLKALLSSPERPADDAFAMRMTRLVMAEETLLAERRAAAEEKLLAARRAAWKRFGTEMAAAAAAIVVFILLAKAGPAPDSSRIVPVFSPAMAGLLLLALWLIVSWRPSTADSTR